MPLVLGVDVVRRRNEHQLLGAEHVACATTVPVRECPHRRHRCQIAFVDPADVEQVGVLESVRSFLRRSSEENGAGDAHGFFRGSR
ncbi:hypothetical protein EN35_15220 [Rhodococcus qingshengii]|nr:hypothetical protein EN35_15220 [Rhodococcus qingshengii]